MSTNQPKPRYRVVAEHAFLDHLGFRSQGAEIELTTWPKAHQVEPLNTEAERIVAYYEKRCAQLGLPKAPYRLDHGFHLPALLKRMAPPSHRDAFAPIGSEIVGYVSCDRAEPAMPRYTLPTGGRVGSANIEAGEAFAFVGWPPHDFEPANPEAEAVITYHAQHKDHPDLLSSPYCLYRQDIYLPVLRELTPREQRRPNYNDQLATAGRGPEQPSRGPEAWSSLQPRSTALGSQQSGINRAKTISREQRPSARYTTDQPQE